MSKAYQLAPDYILYKMSYANMALYSAVIPSYESKVKKDKGTNGYDESTDANNPDNFTEETEVVIKA